MQHVIALYLIILLQVIHPVMAQDYKELESLNTPNIQSYYSPGQNTRATNVTNLSNKAFGYYTDLLDFKPGVTLLILAPDNWTKHAKSPVYGMPHYFDDKTLIVASSNNPFWNSFLPPLDKLPTALRAQVEKTYRDGNGISMQPFFDLLALHELGHAFHMQAKINMQRKWMGELFVNILLHTYIAENDTASLAALTLFPQMVIGSGSKEYSFKTLKVLDEQYLDIARNHPRNYGWYQCRLHAAAARIYERDGREAGLRLWNALKNTTEQLDDTGLLQLMEKNKLASIADMIRNWDKETVK